MILNPSRDDSVAQIPLDAVIAAHGARKVLFAAMAALLQVRLRKSRPPDLAALDSRLRADIGLPPVARATDWTQLLLRGQPRL